MHSVDKCGLAFPCAPCTRPGSQRSHRIDPGREFASSSHCSHTLTAGHWARKAFLKEAHWVLAVWTHDTACGKGWGHFSHSRPCFPDYPKPTRAPHLHSSSLSNLETFASALSLGLSWRLREPLSDDREEDDCRALTMDTAVTSQPAGSTRWF